jgi:hypothetical protein
MSRSVPSELSPEQPADTFAQDVQSCLGGPGRELQGLQGAEALALASSRLLVARTAAGCALAPATYIALALATAGQREILPAGHPLRNPDRSAGLLLISLAAWERTWWQLIQENLEALRAVRGLQECSVSLELWDETEFPPQSLSPLEICKPSACEALAEASQQGWLYLSAGCNVQCTNPHVGEWTVEDALHVCAGYPRLRASQAHCYFTAAGRTGSKLAACVQLEIDVLRRQQAERQPQQPESVNVEEVAPPTTDRLEILPGKIIWKGRKERLVGKPWGVLNVLLKAKAKRRVSLTITLGPRQRGPDRQVCNRLNDFVMLSARTRERFTVAIPQTPIFWRSSSLQTLHPESGFCCRASRVRQWRSHSVSSGALSASSPEGKTERRTVPPPRCGSRHRDGQGRPGGGPR